MSVGEARRAYDQLAPTYDEDFTASLIGRLQRDAFWRILGDRFKDGDHVLDLGCGTGEDAVRLARRGCTVDAIDVSPGMVAAARDRMAFEEVTDQVVVEPLSIEHVADLAPELYDGVISNFGPANCLEDLNPLARTLGDRVRPGGLVAISLMSRTCLWETLLYPLTAVLHKAFRGSLGNEDREEFTESRVAADATFPVNYPSMRSVALAFEPEFALDRAPGIGVFLPPTYLEPFAQRFPRMTKFLALLDRVVAAWPLFRSVGDHRVAILRRRGA